jgi:hypothetical protein
MAVRRGYHMLIQADAEDNLNPVEFAWAGLWLWMRRT